MPKIKRSTQNHFWIAKRWFWCVECFEGVILLKSDILCWATETPFFTPYLSFLLHRQNFFIPCCSNTRQVKNIQLSEFVILLTHIHISGKVHLNAEYLKNFSTDKFLSVQYPSNTPPSAKLGLCLRTIYSKLSTSDHNLFQIFLPESKFFFEHQIFLSLSGY